MLLYSTDSSKYNNKPLIEDIYMFKFYPLMLLGMMTIGHTPMAGAATVAEKADKENLHAVTIFVDISRFNRKNGAAKKMTQSHQEFARYGYALVAVNVYTENGDLEGFFVSYRKSDVIHKL